MSLKQKLITSFLAIAFIPIVLFAYLSFSDAKEALQRTRIAGLESVADLKAATLEEFFADLREDISIAQDYYNVKTNLPILTEYASDRTHPEYLAAKKMLDGQLRTWLKTEKQVVDVMLLNPEGNIVYVTNANHAAADLGNPLPDPFGEAFKNGISGFYVSDVFRNPLQSDQPGMLITAPVHGFDDGLVGVIAIEIDMTTLFDALQDTTGMGETGETVVAENKDGVVVIINPLRHDPDAALKRRITIGSKEGMPIQRAVLGETGQSLSVDYRGKEILAYWRYMPSLDWGLVVKIDTEEAFASIIQLRKRMVTIGVVLLVLTGIVALFVAQTIAKPIQSLQRATVEVGSGNLDYKVGLDTADEIGQLSSAFDIMTSRLKEITASRNELNLEIAERKVAEDKLREARDQLELKVVQRTRNLRETNEILQREISDRKRVQRELQAQAEIIENMTEGVYLVRESDAKIVYANPACEEMFAYDRGELIGKHVSVMNVLNEKCLQETAGEIMAAISETGGWKGEIRNRRKNGTEFWSYANMSQFDHPEFGPVIVATHSDITIRKQAEEAKKRAESTSAELQNLLLHAQKMEAVGTLAGGIAHDFNNILAGVYGFAELAQHQVPQQSKAFDSLEEIIHAVDRAKDLTQQILTFSRKSEQNRIPVDLRSTIRDALKFLRPTLPATIKVQEKINVTSAWIMADPTQMQQVLINLSTNAAAAMRERGGVLELILDEIRVEEQAAVSLSLGLSSGRYIKLTVRDTGAGISSKVLDRIFDPFFTTKEVGEGTGLGLSIVHAIVTDHDGLITVDSAPGAWTSFTILLPRIEAFETAHGSVPTRSQRGLERILYVDDEETITHVNKQLLEKLGYDVVVTNSSLDALEIFRSQCDDFDLLITDQTMPGMTGDELVREILDIRPDTPIILCTGYSEKIDENNALALGIQSYLQKPVSINTLGETIRSIFDEERQSTKMT